MNLISLETLIQVYKEYGNDFNKSTVEIKEMVDYCEIVRLYLHSVNSTDLEFYKGMLAHDNFLDRMVTFLYIFDNISGGGFMKYVNFSILIKNNKADYKLVRELMNIIYPNIVCQQQAYYEVFKNEIISKKREDILHQLI